MAERSASLYGSCLKQIAARRVIESGANMFPFRTKPNPAFKIAQSLPILIGHPAEVRNSSVPINAQFPRGGSGKLEFAGVVSDRGLSNENGKLHRFAPSAFAFNCGLGPGPSFGYPS